MNDQQVVALMGRIIVPLPERPTDYEREVSRLQEAEFPTANCFYLKDVLREVGGFDERFKMAWREDADLFFRVLSRGHAVGNAPSAVVFHPVRPARWGISLRQQRKAFYNALLYKNHPALYRKLIQPRPPVLYYAIVAMLGFGVLAAWWGSVRLTAAALSMWGILTLWFTVQRLRQTALTASHVAEMAVTSVLIPPLALFWRLAGAIRHRVLFF
jgi:cellulose synthase/poly-beta-1,6-N-acetylglucosamine synthase-like glycosyltransferase